MDVTNKYNCSASDTIIITAIPPIISQVDTAVCPGQQYFAGGKWQTLPGSYSDTLKAATGCDSILLTNLTIRDSIPRRLSRDTAICPWSPVILEVTTPGATGYQWQDGSSGSSYTVSEPGRYWVKITVPPCSRTDTMLLETCSDLIFPNAFSPNGDGLNDFFRPKGARPENFLMVIYDRWGQLVFQGRDINSGWDGRVNNQEYPPGTYTYFVTFSDPENPEITRKQKGTFTLVR